MDPPSPAGPGYRPLFASGNFAPHPDHLEVFYHVARRGGIRAAARHMPYGVGPSAISEQIIALEAGAGVKLFERKPFRLTPHGRLLQAEIAPFFDRLPGLGERLRRLSASTVAVAFSGLAATGFRPAAAAALRAALPDGERAFFTGRSDDLETWLREDRVQFVVMAGSARPRAGVRCEILGHAPLGLLVPRRLGPVASGWFWRQERITEPLIAPPGDDPVARTFAQGLQALRVDWPVRLRIDSMEAALQLVADGQGVAVVPVLSPRSIPSGVRLLPLPGFGRVPFAALWRPLAGPWLKPLLAALQATARRFWPPGSSAMLLVVLRWDILPDECFVSPILLSG